MRKAKYVLNSADLKEAIGITSPTAEIIAVQSSSDPLSVEVIIRDLVLQDVPDDVGEAPVVLTVRQAQRRNVVLPSDS